MRTRTRLALAAVAALATAAPALAATTYSTGRYEGTTGQVNKNTGKHRKISLHADQAAGQVSNIKFVTTGKCNDGSHSTGSQGTNGNHLFADVDGSGHFSLIAFSKTHATKLTMSGALAGTKASGTFKITSRFDDSGTPDPNGSIKCTSGTVHWSAKWTSG
jgi:hypothetical protein